MYLTAFIVTEAGPAGVDEWTSSPPCAALHFAFVFFMFLRLDKSTDMSERIKAAHPTRQWRKDTFYEIS